MYIYIYIYVHIYIYCEPVNITIPGPSLDLFKLHSGSPSNAMGFIAIGSTRPDLMRLL